MDTSTFCRDFSALLEFEPLSWQRRLFNLFVEGNLPAALDLPTGLGKTSVMAIWLIARAHNPKLPRRLVYVVDRRAVVDQATTEAEKLRHGLDGLPDVKRALGIGERQRLPISTLRGQCVDNREWLADPAMPAIVVGTVDMIGSRLLFSGYGVSPKMRPYHAGLLGADALVILDEAHLVPPFEKLMEAIETGTTLFGPVEKEIVPPFDLLSLSATGRERRGDVFELLDEDLNDAVVRQRLGSGKRLKLEPPLATSDLPGTMAELAWTRGAGGRTVIVFCNSRKTAQKVYDDLKGRLEKSFKPGAGESFEISDTIELIVGARRVHERNRLANSKAFKRFSSKSRPEMANEQGIPAFLVCTSAGEVGVDMDADHMVCDLVAWDRMVQRLGRVNRFGKLAEGSLIDVFPAMSDKDKEAEVEVDAASIETWRRPFDSTHWATDDDGRRDASPGMLRRLGRIGAFRSLTDAATTPAPLRPALTRPLLDAWSMTSLDQHTGRPDVAPWLRGWVEDQPQTTIVWREFLPVRIADAPPPTRKELDDFFEAAPPHVSEQLETETWRVVAWVMNRAGRLIRKLDKPKTTSDGNGDASDPRSLTKDDVVAFALAPDGELRKGYGLHELVEIDHDKKRKERLETEFSGATLVVDRRLGGLKVGLLDENEDQHPVTLDSDEAWSRDVGMRVRRANTLDTASDSVDWRFAGGFAATKSKDGEVTGWLIVEQLKVSSNSEDGRSISNPQSLDDHRACVASKARSLASALGLRGDLARALEIAARLHDEGKKASRWQHAFNAERDKKKFNLTGPLAKTKGPINRALLDGYRHEFGSLPYIERDVEFRALPEDLRDLVLHLVVAHHGRARPVIETTGCDDAPPSALEARARDVALRFARLQKIWGPWGLAWWEALLRAADQLASRENDQPMGIGRAADAEAA